MSVPSIAKGQIFDLVFTGRHGAALPVADLSFEDPARIREGFRGQAFIQVDTQALQAERNSRSKSIGKAKAAGEDIAPLLAAVEGLGDQLKAREAELGSLQDELNDLFDLKQGKGGIAVTETVVSESRSTKCSTVARLAAGKIR